jgi:hypothetical protein
VGRILEADHFIRSLIMGKGNKVRKREIKKPKQNKAGAKK